MIPYLEIPSLTLFGLEFHAFGALVALGFLVGSHLAARRAIQVGLSPQVIYDAGMLFLIFGILSAHVFDLVTYNPELLLKEPWRLLYVWSGLSSYGGFLGGGVALAIYMHKHKLPFLPYADALMFGLLPGWMFGRIGCYTAHDHPGRLTHFFLAVAYPGGARHDLGFYEVLLSIALIGVIYWMGRRRVRPPGQIFSVTIIFYAIARFFLDFLRATDLPGADARYAGLTPAQYTSIGLLLWGAYLFRNANRESE